MADDTLLTWSSGVTVRQLKKWIQASDRDHIADFLKERFTERYIAPIRGAGIRNGFLIMGVSCLVVEALESFRQGWPSSERVGNQPFIDFFGRDTAFQVFRPVSQLFYKHVRCGILHQGETTGGWTITRKDVDPLLNGKQVNAVKFHNELALTIDSYVAELKAAGITDELWTNCLVKLYATIRNCD